MGFFNVPKNIVQYRCFATTTIICSFFVAAIII